MPNVMQMIADQSFEGAPAIETDWAEDEDPEHHDFETLSEETPDHESAWFFLNRAEFREALEDQDFRADLKWACQFTFNSFQQSTHATWEDLQQEILIKFARWLPDYRGEAKRRTVLVKIAKNLLIDAQRAETSKRRRHERINLDDLVSEPVIGEPRREIESRIFVNECRKILSQQELTVFDEHAVYGNSLRQLAARSGVSPAAMSKRWAKIMTKLPLK